MEQHSGPLIRVKFLPATDTKSARFKAIGPNEDRSITRSKEYGLDEYENALAVAKELAGKFGWHGKLIGFWYGHDYYFTPGTK
jgi:hypothetical protein